MLRPLTRSLRAMIRPGPAIRPEHLRFWVMLSVGVVTAFAIHVVYTGLFAALGVFQMVTANLFSLGAYAFAMAMTQRGRYLAAVAACAVELCIHQSLAVHFIGWSAGMQYYLLVLPAVIFSMPGRRVGLKVGMTAVPTAVFMGLLATDAGRVPVHSLPPTLLSALELVNVAVIFGLLGFFAMNFAQAAEVAERRMREEYERAEMLLHNILPASIADRLKTSGGVIADGFADASVLFADIVGFTTMSSEMSPQRVVAMLDELFSDFDDLVGARGLEKIKTIGDAYMVAGGVPGPMEGHADALADLALAMQTAVAARGAGGEPALQMRIGIHSGPVVAGVIGRRRFIYDLWGDTVNTAARMESHGVAGAVQISRATRDRLGGRWVVEPRGEITVKGKGEMEVFLLRARAD